MNYITILCPQCKELKQKPIKNYNRNIKNGHTNFCSLKCSSDSDRIRVEIFCKFCNKKFWRNPCDLKKYKNSFCGNSCSASYRNTHKTTGYRRSKLEIWIEQKLTSLFPNLKIDYNKTNTINSELDIYIPQLKLAFELNGKFHYEPIYGLEKLVSIQNNDRRKFAACAEKSISFCIIDTSKQKYFKENTAQEYLDIITNIINLKLN